MEIKEITKPNILKFLLTGILILNIADYVFTEIALSLGAEEANPFLAPIVDTIWFPIVKVFIISTFVLFIWLVKEYILAGKLKKVILFGLWVAFIAYFAVMVWHIYGLLILL